MSKRTVFCICKNTYVLEEFCSCGYYEFSAWTTYPQGIGKTQAMLEEEGVFDSTFDTTFN